MGVVSEQESQGWLQQLQGMPGLWIDPRAVVAIAITETDTNAPWRRTHPGSMALGISSGYSTGGIPGVQNVGRFNVYSNIRQAAEDMQSFLIQNSRYNQASRNLYGVGMQQIGADPLRFLTALHYGGYAA